MVCKCNVQISRERGKSILNVTLILMVTFVHSHKTVPSLWVHKHTVSIIEYSIQLYLLQQHALEDLDVKEKVNTCWTV